MLPTLTSNTPRITLVGAGPGDPDLITVKGMKALKSADVVLYDALVHEDLLLYAPENALKIYVGKRVGVCQMSQDKINETLVASALTYGHVVRLKGGDSFVFGRGHEEMEYAKSNGVSVDVVPGVTSAISVPELQQIPLTRRGINESFWVITGTTKNHQMSEDIYKAAHSDATVVILMGTRKLKQICEVYKSVNRAYLPVAIIQSGSYDNEKIVMGTIDSIVEEAERNEIQSPAVIVIGEVVTLHPEYLSSMTGQIASTRE